MITTMNGNEYIIMHYAQLKPITVVAPIGYANIIVFKKQMSGLYYEVRPLLGS